jgi:hypothetical protein
MTPSSQGLEPATFPERFRSFLGASEGEAFAVASLAEPVFEEGGAEDAGDGDAAVAGLAFRFDQAGCSVPGVVDVDDVGVEVDVVPVEGLEFPAA